MRRIFFVVIIDWILFFDDGTYRTLASLAFGYIRCRHQRGGVSAKELTSELVVAAVFKRKKNVGQTKSTREPNIQTFARLVAA